MRKKVMKIQIQKIHNVLHFALLASFISYYIVCLQTVVGIKTLTIADGAVAPQLYLHSLIKFISEVLFEHLELVRCTVHVFS